MMAQDKQSRTDEAALAEEDGQKHVHDFTNRELHAITAAIAAGAREVSAWLTPVPSLRGDGQSDSQTILALLAYCYARQIYSSTEIESRLRHDPGFRHFWQGELPDASALRRFRAENRKALEICVEAALRGLAEERRAEGRITRVTAIHLAEDARRRMIMAMFIDGMETDPQETPSL